MVQLSATSRIDYIYRNWAGTYFSKPKCYFEPETISAIAEIYQLAKIYKTTVRFIGSAASPSNLPCTDGFMVCMKRFNRILNIDKEKLQVKVQGGITLHDLQEVLAENGLAIAPLPSVNFITLAGAISTSTHGNGINHGNLSSNVVNMDILTPGGELMYTDYETNKEIFLAAKVSLGLLGAIINVTLQVEPSFNVIERKYSCDFDYTVENIDKIISASEFSKIIFYPHTDRCVVFEMDRIKKKPSTTCNLVVIFYRWMLNEIIGKHIFYYALKLREDTKNVLIELKEMILHNNLNVHFPIEIRFVQGDDAYLSHNNGYDSMMINILSFRPGNLHFPKERYFSLFDKNIRKKFNGRSHWAKTNTDTPLTLRNLYPEFDKFLVIREIIDPDGVLLNDYAKVHLLALKKALYAIFTQYGDVMEIIAHNSHKTRGQAFVVFKDVSLSANAMRELQSFPFYDKPMRIQYAKSKSDIVTKADGSYVPRVKRSKSEQVKAGKSDKKTKSLKETTGGTKLFDKNEEPNHILFVQNLPPETTSATLQMLFVQFPGFHEVRVVPGRVDIAFVEFENQSNAGKAREALQGFMVSQTHSIVISYAKK